MLIQTRILAGSVLLFIFLTLAAAAPIARAQSPVDDFAHVWQRVEQAGGYSFHADVRHTRTPRATVANAGYQSTSSLLYVDGRTDLNTAALDLTLWSGGGSALDMTSGLELRVRND